ncbi:hypothetical protein V6Z12_A07G188100 [Gossypium hirsutum]
MRRGVEVVENERRETWAKTWSGTYGDGVSGGSFLPIHYILRGIGTIALIYSTASTRSFNLFHYNFRRMRFMSLNYSLICYIATSKR